MLNLYYGGTFDPFHNGHLAIARAARDELGVPVHLVPAADPPHRPAPGADATQRALMLERALRGESGLQVDRRELERAAREGRPSYTVETLEAARAEHGADAPIAWLLGADSFVGLNRWHRWQDLLKLAHLVVADRPGSVLRETLPAQLAQSLAGHWAGSVQDVMQAPAGWVWRLHQPLQEESASQVRQCIADGGDWRSLVPAAVADGIEAGHLYGYRPDTA